MQYIAGADSVDQMKDLRSVDLNLLVDLDALLSMRSVTEAARRLNLSQSAMSGSLSRLRRLFDDPLMVRNGRVLVLTPRAEALIPPVKEILHQIDGVFAQSDDFDPRTTTRSFSISASDYATAVVLAPLLRGLADDAPNVTVNVLPRSPDVPAVLRLDSADLVIEPREMMGDSPLPGVSLFSDRWVCMLDGSMHEPAVLARLERDHYLQLPHLVYSIGQDRQLNYADRHLASLGVRRRIELTVESFLMAPLLIRGTSLVSLVLERAASMLPLDGLRLVDPPIPVPGITDAMYWNPRHSEDPGHRWLRQRLADTAARLTPTGDVS
ncbi:LysR family transcriptional regulator [Rhodococcus opacus RKJ300 = JCM 13270]|uniref:LysR family transcriptional regulator n=2 Tax=Nocardiaceae TaxID=85025 RepID=I0WZN9_RHOOP|nr:LysR family transcriptional regulator [Rhodococcus opacus RKJ300 = JCM 13270]